MTPLQKIAMGLVIVLLPANFPADPHPAWRFYDALPDPIGWALVLAGVWALARARALPLTAVGWVAVVALLVSVPLWFPQLNHYLVPKYNPDIGVSMQWLLSLPQNVFGLALAHRLGRAGRAAEPPDGYLAGRFGALSWGFLAVIVLPAVAYGADVDALKTPALLLVFCVNAAFIYYLFAVNRRELLGGPGPRDWAAIARGERRRDRR